MWQYHSYVASRPRIGGYSQARTLQLVWTSWRETQLGRDQLERFSWTGIGYNRTRQVLGREGFLMCICICSSPGRIDSNKQCFHNQYMHTCLLRATVHTHETPAHPLLWWLSGPNSGRFMYRHLIFKKRVFALVAGGPYGSPQWSQQAVPTQAWPGRPGFSAFLIR